MRTIECLLVTLRALWLAAEWWTINTTSGTTITTIITFMKHTKPERCPIPQMAQTAPFLSLTRHCQENLLHEYLAGEDRFRCLKTIYLQILISPGILDFSHFILTNVSNSKNPGACPSKHFMKITSSGERYPQSSGLRRLAPAPPPPGSDAHAHILPASKKR